MTVSIASAAECRAFAVSALGLSEAGVDLFSVEGLAASLRRAASFLCPCAPRQIVDAVLEVLNPLRSDPKLQRSEVADVVDQLIAGGDLVELRQGELRTTRLLYLGPPTYVEKEPGRYLLAGVRPFGAPLIPADCGEVIYAGHTRTLVVDATSGDDMLRASGLHDVDANRWVRQPAKVTSAELVAQMQARLMSAMDAGDATQFLVLDPSSQVNYYRGRWRSLRPTDTGDFIARRPQAYGADLWCALTVDAGVPQRVFDFPVDDPAVPGRDEAWRFQAAIDAERNAPQRLRLRSADGDSSDVTIDFFGPIPGWAERRVQLAASAVDRLSGALFTFRASEVATQALEQYLAEMLWMRAIDERGVA